MLRPPPRRSSGKGHAALSAFGLQSVEPALAETVIARLEDVERALVVAARADDPFIDEAASYLLNAGGKRF